MSNDIEDIIEDIVEDNGDVKDLVKELISINPTKFKDVEELYVKLRRKYQVGPSKREIKDMYNKYFSTTKISPNLQKWMVKSQMRSNSGVLVVTIVLAPDKFSCKYDCSYCPQETDLQGNHTQPRSYLSNEPAMRRALDSNFSVRGQFENRINAYTITGNILSENCIKIEVIFSGGTWESYPIEYREKVIAELYWSANTYTEMRNIKSLIEEIKINETSQFRIIGFTLETRPDNITPETIKQYRRWGVTRMQIGVQHYDDEILKKMNRKCYTKDTIRAIRLLKQAGMKVVVHLMPDLPGSSPEQDKWMFDQAIYNSDLQFDDVKIYPTAVCKAADDKHIVKSRIADMYNAGTFIPYSEKNLDDLINVLIYYKKKLNPWVRIQRLVRDIPHTDIQAGYNKISNLRQIIQNKEVSLSSKKEQSPFCKCIRCMEIGDKEYDNLTPILVVRKYNASEGVEYHISLEAHNMNKYQELMYNLILIINNILYFLTGRKCYWSGCKNSYIALFGFLRLRFDNNPGGDFIPEINGCALIREVHVYGTSLGVGVEGTGSQHRGYGKLLVKTAEDISKNAGWNKVAIIAGVGTREYYKNKCGYKLKGTYMLKHFDLSIKT